MSQVKKLTPEAVIQLWPHIKDAVRAGLPPMMDNSKEALDYTLGMLSQGRMQMWILFKDDDLKEPRALAITSIIHEPGFDYKNLLIYALVSFGGVSTDEWKVGFETIKKFAKEIGCHRIIGFTNVQRVVDITQSLGGKAEYVLLTLEV